jgi:hypothetical protein
VCWSNEAKNLVTDMNTYPEPDLMTEKKDLCKETAQVIEFINAHLGVTVKMMLATFANMNENTMQHLMRKLLKAKKISSSNGCPRVFFPASTPQDAIESISSTFKKARKEKNGKG